MIRILSAGAAQAVVEPVMADFRRHGEEFSAEFNAVGAMKARLLEGAPADLIILSSAMIDELIGAGQVVAGSRADLGRVGIAGQGSQCARDPRFLMSERYRFCAGICSPRPRSSVLIQPPQPQAR